MKDLIKIGIPSKGRLRKDVLNIFKKMIRTRRSPKRMSPKNVNKVKEEVAALNLGNKIRNLRKQRALTLQEVSDLTGLSKPLLSQLENNIAAPPIATLIKISTALGVKISHFFI